MYYILYEGLKIESNEPVYCTVYIINIIQFHNSDGEHFNCKSHTSS